MCRKKELMLVSRPLKCSFNHWSLQSLWAVTFMWKISSRLIARSLSYKWYWMLLTAIKDNKADPLLKNMKSHAYAPCNSRLDMSSEAALPPDGNNIKEWRQFWSRDLQNEGRVIICGVWSLVRLVVINEGETHRQERDAITTPPVKCTAI